jgi:hypothetical protein
VAHHGDLRAATAIWRMTGDLTPVLDTLRTALAQGRPTPPRSWSLSFVSEVGEALLPLVTVARQHLTGVAAPTHPQREIQILAARVVAAATRPQPVLATVRAILVAGHTRPGWPQT